MDNKSFLGSGMKFPLQVDGRTGFFALSLHEDNIFESIGIIIRTHKGERIMRPKFGSTVHDYIFADTGNSVEDSIAFNLQEQITLQEPRVRDVEVKCNSSNISNGELTVEIAYTVRSTNNRYNKVYPYFDSEGSEV